MMNNIFGTVRKRCVFLLLLTTNVFLIVNATAVKRPNIVFVVADDLGRNDMSITDPRIYSPNLEKLYKESLKLDYYYTQSTCTPSRASFMTGYYPFHLGLQHGVIRPDDPRYIPLNVPLFPQRLHTLGYTTAAIGKWHLGHCDSAALPTNRGFDSFYGHYLGSSDYFKHIRSYHGVPGHDFRENTTVTHANDGQYDTELFTDRAVKIIENHDKKSPLYIYLAHLTPHEPLQPTEKYLALNRANFPDKTDTHKLDHAAMVSALDESVKEIIDSLKKAEMWDNTLFVFSTDNGGSVTEGGSNYPLRGGKGNFFEGGTRSVGWIHGKDLGAGTFDGMFHAVDWFPTLLHAAAESDQSKAHILNRKLPLDGIDQWEAFKENKAIRDDLVYNIDELTATAAYRDRKYKIMIGRTNGNDGWFNHHHDLKTQTKVGKLSRAKKFIAFPDINKESFFLFDLENDPDEKNDLSEKEPGIAYKLYQKLIENYKDTLVPAFNPPAEPKANPKFYGNEWSPGWCPNTNYKVDII